MRMMIIIIIIIIFHIFLPRFRLRILDISSCAWATLLWASRTMRSTMKLFLGRITGCLKPSENSCDLLNLPPTRMRPSWSRKGSRRYKVLDFLISDFIAFANWRSLSQSTRRTSCRAFLSLGNAPLCTSLRMVFSALSSSSTLTGLRFVFSVCSALSALPLGSNAPLSVLGFGRSIQEMDFFIRCHSERRASLFKRSTFSSTSMLCTRTFLTSGSLCETSSMSPGG